MKRKTMKSLGQWRCIVTYLDSIRTRLASHKGTMSLRELPKIVDPWNVKNTIRAFLQGKNVDCTGSLLQKGSS